MDRFLHALHDRLQALKDAADRLLGRKTSAALKIAGLAGVLLYIALRLSDIGWSDVLAAAPTSPLFYVTALALFFAQPLAETLTYRIVGRGPVPDGLRIFMRKRILNESVLSYAGEAYLYPALTASGRFTGPRALAAIKDVNLVSAFLSNSMTIVFVIALVGLGKGRILETIFAVAPIPIAIFAVVFIGVYGAGLVFFRRVVSTPPRRLGGVALVQASKVAVVAALQILQWSLALPGVALGTWLSFIAVQLVVRRVPFLPNGELVFLGVGLSLIGFADAEGSRVAAMLVAAAAASQSIQALAFMFTIGAGRPRKTSGRGDAADVTEGDQPIERRIAETPMGHDGEEPLLQTR